MQRRVIIPLITLGLLLGPRAALAQGTLLWQQTLDGTAGVPLTTRIRWRWTPKATCSPPASPRIPAPATTSPSRSSPRDGTLLWQQTLNGTANG